MPLAVYGHPFSSYTQKALIALYENATPFAFREVGPEVTEHGAEVRLAYRIPERFGAVRAYRVRVLARPSFARPSFARSVDEARQFRNFFPLEGRADRLRVSSSQAGHFHAGLPSGDAYSFAAGSRAQLNASHFIWQP